MGTYKSYKAIIIQAELAAMSSEAAATFLKKRAKQSEDEWHRDEVNADIEAALLTRNDQLINLALAQYARFTFTLKTIFDISETSSPLRLAVLSNKVVGDKRYVNFPIALFKDSDQAAVYLSTAPEDEINALFENQNIDDSFLVGVLEGNKPWDRLPDDQLVNIVTALHLNERMQKPYINPDMDGYAQFSYNDVFNAAWKLAERVEPTAQWSRSLCWLYDRLQTVSFSIKEPLELATKWHPDKTDTVSTKQESKDAEYGSISGHRGVRKGLARLALSENSKLIPTLLASEDSALRSAVYANGKITPLQLSTAYSLDGELLFFQAIHNHEIWKTEEGRNALHTIAWAVVNNNKTSDLFAANMFNSMREDLAKKHPTWFTDEGYTAPEMIASDEPATKGDIAELAEHINQSATSQKLEQIKQLLNTVNGRIGWVWWFSLGAIVASIRHF